MKFIKLYHYSNTARLKTLDPAFYGSGVTRGSECRHGIIGIPKVYFYNVNQPASCVASGSRQLYEVYFPYEWKSLIYDMSTDHLELYDLVKKEFIQKQRRTPYEYEMKEAFEQAIKAAGFKGWQSTASQLPHAVILFDAISTLKPRIDFFAYDWADNLIEIYQLPKIGEQLFSFFNPAVTSPKCDDEVSSLTKQLKC